jgi:hypothetical protein
MTTMPPGRKVRAGDDDVALALVRVTIREGPRVDASLAHHWSTLIPSGTLAVGDADDEERVAVTSGEYLVQVQLDDDQFAENVEVWLTPIRRAKAIRSRGSENGDCDLASKKIAVRPDTWAPSEQEAEAWKIGSTTAWKRSFVASRE